jgi:hypothetical protein
MFAVETLFSKAGLAGTRPLADCGSRCVQDRPWYGSPGVLEQWVDYLIADVDSEGFASKSRIVSKQA